MRYAYLGQQVDLSGMQLHEAWLVVRLDWDLLRHKLVFVLSQKTSFSWRVGMVQPFCFSQGLAFVSLQEMVVLTQVSR